MTIGSPLFGDDCGVLLTEGRREDRRTTVRLF